MKKPTSVNVTINYDDGTFTSKDLKVIPMEQGENPHLDCYRGLPLQVVYKGEKDVSLTNCLDFVGYATVVELGETMKYLDDPRKQAVVINKHTNPPVYAVGITQLDALKKAMKGDTKSPFGGVLSTNYPLTFETAEYLRDNVHLDAIGSPGFEEKDGKKSYEVLIQKMKNVRVIDLEGINTWEKIHEGIDGFNMFCTIGGTVLLPEIDKTSFFNTPYRWEVLSERKPTREEYIDSHLAWIGAKRIFSNSFAFVRDGTLFGQCGGQTNREDSASFANTRAASFGNSLMGTMSATDSFLFDSASVDLLHSFGVEGVVHPTRKDLTTGGPKTMAKDGEILAKVNEYDMIAIMPRLGPNGEDPWRVFRHLPF